MTTNAISVVAFALEQEDRARVKIHGMSMAPTLRSGMVAEIEPLPARLRRGEILVYDIGGMLVAHRYLGRLSEERYLLCGDAQPKLIEHISRKHILGRVARIYASDADDADEVSAHLLQLLGRVMMHSRALRATLLRFREMCIYLARRRRTEAFALLSLVVAQLLHGRYAEASEILASYPANTFFRLGARHGLGGILFRLMERAAAAGHPARRDLLEGVRSGRWVSAVRADDLRTRAAEVREVLAGAGITPIFLKGAARVLRGDADADIHFSTDVDIIVPEAEADTAVGALRARGYDHHVSERERRVYARRRQHRAPLWNQDAVVPIEVHTQLCIPGSVSQAYDYKRLLPFSLEIDSPIGRVRVLDRVGTAIHLAYHGRECRVLRDIVLLAELLTQMQPIEYTDFMRHIGTERRERVRIESVLLLAHRFAGLPYAARREASAYLTWLMFREEMPLMFQKRGHILEGIYARSLPPYQGVRHVATHAYTWLYNIIATPLLLRWFREYRAASASRLAVLLQESETAKLPDDGGDVA